MKDKIELTLDKYVRPKLSEHYGNVEVISYENNILKIKLLGQCGNCPSAKMTVENVIEEELKKHVPEINEVVLVEGVSDELIEFAKKLLKHKK
ncbi:MAG TPA: NifU family protein [Clostridiales bacterium]|nr:NifU family protein [Clostridiales bacterium]